MPEITKDEALQLARQNIANAIQWKWCEQCLFPWHDGLCECQDVAKTQAEYDLIDLLSKLGVEYEIQKDEVLPQRLVQQQKFKELTGELFQGLAVVDLQEQINAIRQQAEKMGLAIVVSWHGEYGVPESVTLQSTDRISIGIKE